MSVEVASLSREKEIYKVTIVGSIVNFVLLAFKFVAGILGHSAAMLADAVHSLSDFVTDVIVLVFVRISNKPQDKDHDYGHGKYETLATAILQQNRNKSSYQCHHSRCLQLFSFHKSPNRKSTIPQNAESHQ